MKVPCIDYISNSPSSTQFSEPHVQVGNLFRRIAFLNLMKLLKQQQIQIQIVNISEYFRSHSNYILPKLFVMVFFLLVLLLTLICLTFFSVYFGRSWCRLLFLRIFCYVSRSYLVCASGCLVCLPVCLDAFLTTRCINNHI